MPATAAGSTNRRHCSDPPRVPISACIPEKEERLRACDTTHARANSFSAVLERQTPDGKKQ